MIHPRFVLFLICSSISLVAYNNCGQKGFSLEGASTGINVAAGESDPLPILGTETNVMKVNVGCGYINQPCVSVQICEPGTTNCQTINNILLDTGSFGLRVFSSLVTVNLPQKTINGNNLAECVSYADGSSNWGPVKSADVVLGSLRASNIAIQAIDSAYATIPADCTKPDTTPTAAGYNGILGVGLFVEDCGAGCATTQDNRIYFSCNGATCGSTAVPIAQQVSNPVAFLPTHNNGVVLQFPQIPSAGAVGTFGYMVLGIGTSTNNTPASANVFKASGNGYFQTHFNGASYNNAFIDSGSNGYFFPTTSTLTACASTSAANGFYCPTTPVTLSAIQAGTNGTPRVTVSFQIANAVDAVTGSNFMFNNVGGNFSGTFDWGMPFYFGRTIFHGIDKRSSPMGAGPYWAW
ncbi:DUF3443 family protein [Bdellovibrio sp. HCB337]|uniref:DUF3443 family protein n=1 Tax=Bdellovibrio sp. HCB337 TaxID=3394358 RepID=UPI0039A64C39